MSTLLNKIFDIWLTISKLWWPAIVPVMIEKVFQEYLSSTVNMAEACCFKVGANCNCREPISKAELSAFQEIIGNLTYWANCMKYWLATESRP